MKAPLNIYVSKSLILVLNKLQQKKNIGIVSLIRRPVALVSTLNISSVFQDTKDRCKEMMSMEDTIDTSSILEIESQSIPTTIKSFWEVVTGSDSPIQNSLKKRDSSSLHEQTNRESSKGRNLYFLLAIFILLLAVLAGLGLTFFSAQK